MRERRLISIEQYVRYGFSTIQQFCATVITNTLISLRQCRGLFAGISVEKGPWRLDTGDRFSHNETILPCHSDTSHDQLILTSFHFSAIAASSREGERHSTRCTHLFDRLTYLFRECDRTSATRTSINGAIDYRNNDQRNNCSVGCWERLRNKNRDRRKLLNFSSVFLST